MAWIAADKMGSLKAPQRAEKRPARHIKLGDEGGPKDACNHGNIEMGYVVAYEHNIRAVVDVPFDDHPDAEDFEAQAVIKTGEAVGVEMRKNTIEEKDRNLNRHAGECQCQVGRDLY